ncbi:hypothetical protein [Pseudonocardia hierapolitana]|uniref:hypothetical protein n=1 Tax=Pseudonocardia hierapolitana TaxID=1128676 RepID=UPI0014790ED5|nr:hypothetical protein [Pseudonocardia hierapolitana]
MTIVRGPLGRPRVVLLAGVLGLAVSACGGGGPPASTAQATDELPAPSLTARPTVELPELSFTPPVRATTPEESPDQPPRTAVALPTRSEALLPTQDPSPAPTPAQAETTGSAPATTAAPAEPTPAPAAAAPAEPSSTSTPSWLWWLLGLLVVAAVVIIVASARARRAKAWAARLDAVVAETTWLAHELLPNTLSSQDAAARLATWTAYRPRVETLTTNLNEVAASAPEDRRAGVDQLRAAVFELRSATDAYTGARPPADAESLGAVRGAQRWTEEALRTIGRAPDSRPDQPVG